MINAIKKNVKQQTGLMIVIFVIMSFISVAYLWHFHMVYCNGDYIYHLNRIRTVKYALFSGHFPLFAQGGTVPYGIILTYYPWLTLLPLVVLSLIIHNPVNLFYISIMLITLTTYLISYYSYHTYDKSMLNSFIFAVFYTNSSVLFDWAFREGDMGAILSMAFLPLALFGIIKLMNYNQGWLMIAFGITFALTSHLATGVIGTSALLIIALLNINQFKISGIFKAIGSGIIILLITSIFWIPDVKITSLNTLVPPIIPKSIGSGILPYVFSTSNFLYGIPEIIGFLAIMFIRSEKFKQFDFVTWGIATLFIIINIKSVSNVVTDLVPWLLHFQMSYRFSLISHLLFSFISVKWLTGKYNDKSHHILTTMLLIVTVLLLFTPILNQIDYHFLLSNRPVATNGLIRKINKINKFKKQHSGKISKKLNDKISQMTQYKMNQESYRQLRYYFYCYDYAPNKVVGLNQQLDTHYLVPILNNNGNLIRNERFYPHKNGIEFNVDDRNENVQLPIVIYRGVKYRFMINHHVLRSNRINHRLTNKGYRLVTYNLKKGSYFISLNNAKFK